MKQLTLLLLLGLTACAGRQVKVEPPTFACPDACATPCVAENGDTGIRWEADPDSPEAWDDLAGSVLDLLVQKLRTCEVNRSTCNKCIQNLKDQGVIQ